MNKIEDLQTFSTNITGEKPTIKKGGLFLSLFLLLCMIKLFNTLFDRVYNYFCYIAI